MSVDTRGFKAEHIGQRIWLELLAGEIQEIVLLELTVYDPPEPCGGITYRLTATTRPSQCWNEGSVYWVGFGDIKNFQIMGETSR